MNKEIDLTPFVQDAKVVERFKSKIQIQANGCWYLMSAVRGGYGCLKVHGKTINGHRFSYVLHHGKLPSNCIVCHKCHDKRCVNPDHLYAGSFKDNVRDSIEQGTHSDFNPTLELGDIQDYSVLIKYMGVCRASRILGVDHKHLSRFMKRNGVTFLKRNNVGQLQTQETE